jgi:hypothetical protein
MKSVLEWKHARFSLCVLWLFCMDRQKAQITLVQSCRSYGLINLQAAKPEFSIIGGPRSRYSMYLLTDIILTRLLT